MNAASKRIRTAIPVVFRVGIARMVAAPTLQAIDAYVPLVSCGGLPHWSPLMFQGKLQGAPAQLSTVTFATKLCVPGPKGPQPSFKNGVAQAMVCPLVLATASLKQIPWLPPALGVSELIIHWLGNVTSNESMYSWSGVTTSTVKVTSRVWPS